MPAKVRRGDQPVHRGAGRAAVLGRRGEIKGALREGYTKRQVWELLREQGVLAIGLETFSRYVGEALETNAATGGRIETASQEEGNDADG